MTKIIYHILTIYRIIFSLSITLNDFNRIFFYHKISHIDTSQFQSTMKMKISFCPLKKVGTCLKQEKYIPIPKSRTSSRSTFV